MVKRWSYHTPTNERTISRVCCACYTWCACFTPRDKADYQLHCSYLTASVSRFFVQLLQCRFVFSQSGAPFVSSPKLEVGEIWYYCIYSRYSKLTKKRKISLQLSFWAVWVVHIVVDWDIRHFALSDHFFCSEAPGSALQQSCSCAALA